MLVKTVFVFICCVHIVLAISCFDCTSVNNSMCLDPSLYDPETLLRFLRPVDCQQGVHSYAPLSNYNFFCRKIHQVILHKNFEPEVRVLRGCGWNRRMDKDCYKADNEDHLETVCQCFEDGCNSATSFTKNLVLILLGLGAALGMKMF